MPLLLLRRRITPGTTAASVTATYLMSRSLLDLLRTEGLSGSDPRLFGGLTLTQTVSLVAVPLALGLLLTLIARSRAPQLG